jgi:hypothetical protein
VTGAYWELVSDTWFSWHPGASLYVLGAEIPTLFFLNPGIKFQALLFLGVPLAGIMSMAWVRCLSLPWTVPAHETIEEHS